MRLDNEIKLDYKDVLLKPKRSTLSSRKDVKMTLGGLRKAEIFNPISRVRC